MSATSTRRTRTIASVTPAQPERWLSVAEVAALWGCSRQHVYNLIYSGLLRHEDIGITRAKTRIPESALEEFRLARARERAAAS